jgi:hypothetical protein
MQHLIVDFNRVLRVQKRDSIDLANDIINSVLHSYAVKNKHQIEKWFIRHFLPIVRAIEATSVMPLNIEKEVVAGNKKAFTWQTPIIESKGRESYFRVYNFSLLRDKNSIQFTTKSLPFFFSEHFFQRLVDRLAWNDENRIYDNVFSEYLGRIAEIVLLGLFLGGKESNAPIRFFNGVALTVIGATNSPLDFRTFYHVQNQEPYLTNETLDPVHTNNFNVTTDNFHSKTIGFAVRFTTWITNDEATVLQKRFCDFLTDYVLRLGESYLLLIELHFKLILPEHGVNFLSRVLIDFRRSVNNNFSDYEQRNIFFESKKQKTLEKVLVSVNT